MKRFILVTVAILISNWGQLNAATFCVGSESALITALSMAAGNNEHDEIKVIIGDYYTQGNTFVF